MDAILSFFFVSFMYFRRRTESRQLLWCVSSIYIKKGELGLVMKHDWFPRLPFPTRGLYVVQVSEVDDEVLGCLCV
jgi:hypothetical protein